MKFTSVVVALIAATATIAAPSPVAFSVETPDVSPSVELNDVARGLLDETSLQARGLAASKSKDKGKGKNKSKDKTKGESSRHELTVTFHDASGPVSAVTQKEIKKVLEKQISKEDQQKFPFCDVNVGDGGSGMYRCFQTAAKKIGEQGRLQGLI
ncbi:hypothetical protein GSI_11854 [Ganoderma sinense ZZ0214-1]|uniref:Transporter n=1 Tax=Ganoderma sinense ZZ0214-1 TaxID=1077348 RepID=A0A2G8RX65_9APHY|nr:hypothetical protein GSI_11854 [Ganoderma sinense ZZ0214-1]